MLKHISDEWPITTSFEGGGWRPPKDSSALPSRKAFPARTRWPSNRSSIPNPCWRHPFTHSATAFSPRPRSASSWWCAPTHRHHQTSSSAFRRKSVIRSKLRPVESSVGSHLSHWNRKLTYDSSLKDISLQTGFILARTSSASSIALLTSSGNVAAYSHRGSVVAAARLLSSPL